MGLFDFFGRESKSKPENGRRNVNERLSEFSPAAKESGKGPVSVFSPTCYDDVETIINCLKTGKTAIVHLTGLKTETAIRILDLLSGAVYALDGGVYEMEKNIFMFSPSGVEIH